MKRVSNLDRTMDRVSAKKKKKMNNSGESSIIIMTWCCKMMVYMKTGSLEGELL